MRLPPSDVETARRSFVHSSDIRLTGSGISRWINCKDKQVDPFNFESQHKKENASPHTHNKGSINISLRVVSTGIYTV